MADSHSVDTGSIPVTAIIRSPSEARICGFVKDTRNKVQKFKFVVRAKQSAWMNLIKLDQGTSLNTHILDMHQSQTIQPILQNLILTSSRVHRFDAPY